MSATASWFEGIFTALVTPFTDDASEVDLSSLRKLIEAQIAAGINGLVACGSTGEAATLTDVEYAQIIRTAREVIGGRVPLVVGVNALSTKRAIECARLVRELGADAAMVVCPPYNKPTQEGLYQHFSAVSRGADLPIIAYNVPGRTAVNLNSQTLARLIKDGSVAGLKEASNLEQIVEAVLAADKGFPVMSGEDALTLAALSCGARGVVSVVSNVVPERMLNLVRAFHAGQLDLARQELHQLWRFMHNIFAETNPIPIKAAAAARGLIASAALRLPLMRAQPETVARLNRDLQELVKA